MVRSAREFWRLIDTPLQWVAAALGGFVLLQITDPIMSIWPSTQVVLGPVFAIAFVLCGYGISRIVIRVILQRRRT